METGAVITFASTVLDPIKDTIVANAPLLVGAGVTVMAVMAGISLIPRVFYKFF